LANFNYIFSQYSDCLKSSGDTVTPQFQEIHQQTK